MAVVEIAEDAGESANVYVVTAGGRTEVLHGVSVFARRATLIERTVAAARSASLF